jgi:hypothetical protein
VPEDQRVGAQLPEGVDAETADLRVVVQPVHVEVLYQGPDLVLRQAALDALLDHLVRESDRREILQGAVEPDLGRNAYSQVEVRPPVLDQRAEHIVEHGPPRSPVETGNQRM